MQNKAWSIGRLETNKCDILLQGQSISGVHATLNFLDGKFYIIDNNSTNGTYINRNSYKSSATIHTEIYPTDIIYFGVSEYKLDDLIEFSIQAVGTPTNSLIMVRGMSSSSSINTNEDNIIHMQNTPSLDNLEEKNQPSNENKKTRCHECSTIVSADEICTECGSEDHMRSNR